MKALTLSLLAGTAMLLARPLHRVPFEGLAAELDTVLGGERATFNWRLGAISYRVIGAGEPLVLLHGINAAASSYEMRRNFSELAAHFRVYAPDLLGFGLSDRPRLRYTAGTYEELLASFLREVVRAPAHVVASSSSSAAAIAVAHASPDLVKSLVLICPTGIEKLSEVPTIARRVAGACIGLPVLGRRLFAGLVTRPSIRYFLRSMTYDRPDQISTEMVDLLHRLGQRSGSRWAPGAFLSGRLNRNIGDQLAQLRQPMLLVWGKNATTTPLADAPAFLERNPRASLKVFDHAKLLPHDEQAEAFNPFVHNWIKEHSA
ncbi:MAG TPA: alpha/beta fold hydrolase [Chloroflexota bacterium]|nr:alpha/beta fold hydrolase [Chloroflexota bacterium]